MANINDYNPIKSVNIEAPLANVKYGEGTYKELIEKCLNGTIEALVNNDGTIVGGNYNSGKAGAQDSLEKMIFERRYSGKDLMGAVLVGFDMKANHATIASIEEDAHGAKITDSLGNVHRVGCGQYGSEPSEERVHYSGCDEDEDLPSDTEIELDELDGDASLANVRHWLKSEYGHCLARGVQPDIEVEDDMVYVSNIEWGRPLSQSELEAL